jgi:hypothetical protein
MNTNWRLGILGVTALVLVACNTSGLSEAPRATFSQIACLDVNGDDVLDSRDAGDPDELPDFNADFTRDEDDAGFLFGIDIPLDPARDKSCDDEKKNPEYLVAHGYIEPSDVSCGEDDAPVLLLGIGGGVQNVRDKGDASGVRSIVDALQKEYHDNDRETIGVIAGQAVIGAQNGHSAMEQWLTHAIQVYFERFPCISVVIVGHSHGAIIADVVGARIEQQYPGRIIAVVKVDRVGEDVYIGDLGARAMTAPVFNIYQSNVPGLSGYPEDRANVENWDASALTDDGEPISHTSLDNSEEARERIVDEVSGRRGRIRD